MSRILILGATSPIARTLAWEFAGCGDELYLAGRDREEIQRLAADITIRFGTACQTHYLNALDFQSHPAFIESVLAQLEPLDGVVFAIGHTGDQPGESMDPALALRIVEINYTSAVSLLAPLANYFEEQGRGFLMGISSVAGDRGRRSNYAYGASKGALSLYLEGLRHRLDRHGVIVLTLKVGFVDTSMTYGKKGLFLVASPEKVARLAYAIRGKPGVHYFPRFWRFIMLMIRFIPERLFNRMDL